MAIDRRAQAYADQFSAVFISRYIAAARAGRPDVIPAPIRAQVTAYVNGTVPTQNGSVEAWVHQTLYDHKSRTGNDYPLPQNFGSGSGGTSAMSGVWGFLAIFFKILGVLIVGILAVVSSFK